MLPVLSVVRPHGGWSQVAELLTRRLFAADLADTHACSRRKAKHAAALHSHFIWRLPSAMLALSFSHSQPTTFFFSSSNVHVFSIPPTHCCIRLHSPNVPLKAAYLYLYCVYQSGSHYSCEAAAINRRIVGEIAADDYKNDNWHPVSHCVWYRSQKNKKQQSKQVVSWRKKNIKTQETYF